MVSGKISAGFLFECTQCGKHYDPNGQVLYLCPACSRDNTPGKPSRGVLKTIYDYPHLRKKISGYGDLKRDGFIGLLPIRDTASLPSLRIGNTPLYAYDRLDGKKLTYCLYIKDDSQNPTFSYKDRASALVSAFAKESGIDTIVTASTGNAGSSLAGICAAQQQNAMVLVPHTAPRAKIVQIMMYGAHIIPVRGTYDQAYDLSIQLTETYGWYNRNTGYNPLTIEGKKTAAFELFEQMADRPIGRIFVPVGDGVIISGVYKGFEDLLALGIIENIPVIVAVQSEKSDNLVRNMDVNAFVPHASTTIADSISVDVPRNFLMAKDMLLKHHGEWITVSDSDILSAAAIQSRNTGIFPEPAAAAAFAGLLKHHREDKLEPGSHNIVMSTGSGLKDLRSFEKTIQLPEAMDPDIDFFKQQWEARGKDACKP